MSTNVLWSHDKRRGWAAALNKTHDSRAGVLYYRNSAGSTRIVVPEMQIQQHHLPDPRPNCCHLNTKFVREGAKIWAGAHRDQGGADHHCTAQAPSLSHRCLLFFAKILSSSALGWLIQAKRRPKNTDRHRSEVSMFFRWTGENKWQSWKAAVARSS
jgi:hypothetical protein